MFHLHFVADFVCPRRLQQYPLFLLPHHTNHSPSHPPPPPPPTPMSVLTSFAVVVLSSPPCKSSRRSTASTRRFAVCKPPYVPSCHSVIRLVLPPPAAACLLLQSHAPRLQKLCCTLLVQTPSQYHELSFIFVTIAQTFIQLILLQLSKCMHLFDFTLYYIYFHFAMCIHIDFTTHFLQLPHAPFPPNPPPAAATLASPLAPRTAARSNAVTAHR